MSPPRILFVTCMPLEQPRSASMAFMHILLRQYPDAFVWYSFRNSDPAIENSYSIPYAYSRRNGGPARPAWLKHFLNLGPRAWAKGKQAAKFGRAQNAQVVLADLAFESIIAGRVAAQTLDVPLLVSIHDDPVNRIRVKGYPAWLVHWHEREFAKTLRAARGVAVISDYMGEAYQKRYGVKTTTLYPGVDETTCLSQKPFDPNQSMIMIGSVGSVNDSANWERLLEALRLLNGTAGGPAFHLLHIGRLPETLPVSEHVEVTGWVPEEEFLRKLARLDLGFLNWSFDPRQAETGRTSLPLKIHSYIQAQVPMIALGPADSTVVRFVRDHRCGGVCESLSPQELSASLRNFVRDDAKIKEAQKSLAQLKQTFSRNAFFDTFNFFTGISENSGHE